MSSEVTDTVFACRVRQIETKKLFGLYDHKVPLSLNDRVSIVHGANGVGKTVLLKLVHSIFSEDYAFLASVPYDEIIITLTNETKITVEQSRLIEEHEAGRPGGAQVVSVIRFTVLRGEEPLPIDFTYGSDQLSFDKWAKELESRTPWLQHLGPNQYFDQRTEQVLTATDLWREYYVDSANRMPTPLSVEVPKELRVTLSQVKTHLVEATKVGAVGTTRASDPAESGQRPGLDANGSCGRSGTCREDE